MSIMTAAIKYASEFHRHVIGQPDDSEGAYLRLEQAIKDDRNREYRRGYEAGQRHERDKQMDKDLAELRRFVER